MSISAPAPDARATVGNERGVVLIVVLLALLVMALMGAGLLATAATEGTISGNDRDTVQAFYLAEAGVEHAKAILRGSGNWNAELQAPQPMAGQALGVGAGNGYSFTITNDAADVAGNATNPVIDTNAVVVVTSTGTYRNGQRIIQAVIGKYLPLTPGGAITSIGATTNTFFNGNAFNIDGHDWNPPQGGAAAAPSALPAKWGVSVPDATQQTNVLNSLTNQQKDNIDGKNGKPSVGVDTTSLTQAQLQNFASAMGTMADNALAPGTHLAGSDCSILGTYSAPKITYVEGGGGLTLTGCSGSGILVVSNGTLTIAGDFFWTGLIVTVGSAVGFTLSGGGNKSVYGSMIVDEVSVLASSDVGVQGNPTVRYSSMAIQQATSGNPKLNGYVASWRLL